MPDHLHLLAAGESLSSNAVQFINRAKQLSGYWYSQSVGGRLWQRSSWDRVLRSQDDTWTVIRYILENPVRAGLVKAPLDYPYSGSVAFPREALLDAFHQRPAG